MMVSFDVVSLFTQVPVEEALTIIQTKYKLQEHIVELTKHFLSNTYFTYEGQRYKQVQGAPMGSPLSPALANKLQEFLEHLNNLHAAIKIMMEREQQNQLPFLDVLLRKKQDGRLAHTVYRKPTHTNRYVNEDSHHHPAQLHSVINTLVTRSLKLADQNHQLEEKKNIRRI